LSDATGLPDSQIVIGPPHEAARQQENDQDKDYLCVFIYRVGYSGFPADAASDDPLYLKAFCMITALGGRSSRVTSGESELRLTGAVAEYFHRNPVLKLNTDNGMKSQMQIVPTPLTLDDINHLWATQNNTPYRLSLSYEFALVPIPIKDRVEKAPRVSVISLTTRATFDLAAKMEESFFKLQVPIVKVDEKRPDWAPHICLLDDNGEPTYSLALETNTLQAQVSLVVLGVPETTLNIEWEVWVGQKWQTGLSGGSCSPKSALLPKDDVLLALLAIPISVPGLIENKGQALLRVTRNATREGNTQLALSSNPVLITVGHS